MSQYDKKTTDVWNLYTRGRDYNQALEPSYYNVCDTNIDFFEGNQWRNLSHTSAMAQLPKPVFNIIKRVGSLFVASLTSSSTQVTYEPLTGKAEGKAIEQNGQMIEDPEAATAAEMATSEVANLFDKLSMDFKIREALFDGIKTGDYCAHFYWNPDARPYGGAYGAYRGEIEMELVDGVNVMFGNPNTRIVEKQPYILIIGRDTTENLRREYLKHHKGSSYEADQIMSDHDNDWQAGRNGKIELGDFGADDKTGKSLFIYCYTKKCKEVKLFDESGQPIMENVLDESGKPIQKMMNGQPMFDAYGEPIYKQKQATELRTSVWVSKHTKYIDIFEPIDTGLEYYPIAWGNWEAVKNCYHGKSLVTDIIPNQIFINTSFALVFRSLQMLGFPKIVYDADILPQWSNQVGQAIAVHDLPPDKRLTDLYGIIQPADMSTQIMAFIDKAVTLTKECLGATDAQMGNVRPDNTSALIALQSSSQVPLENPQHLKYEWVENIGRILLDMMGTYYGERPVVKHSKATAPAVDPSTGLPSTDVQDVKVIEMYDFSRLKNLWLNVRADVGASTYWSKIAVVQTLDNLRQSGILDVIDYLERMPEEYIPRKEELIAKLRKEAQQQVVQMPQGMGEEGPPAAAQGVAAGAIPEDNPAAVIASMPPNVQQTFDALGAWPKKALLQQTKLNTVGV